MPTDEVGCCQGCGLRGYQAVALSKGRTAVHGQDLTGNVVGVFAGKEYEGRSDILRLPEPTQGYAGGPLFECGLVDFQREVSDSHRPHPAKLLHQNRPASGTPREFAG